jgi:predicted ArsR family transcriptional regulator
MADDQHELHDLHELPGSETRRQILLLLKKRGPLDVAALAQTLGLTGMGVRRHLDALVEQQVCESTVERRPVGRPRHLYRLTPTGEELFPRRYDTLALQVLEDLEDTAGREAVDAVFERRGRRLVEEYRSQLAGSLPSAIADLAGIRDEAGYLCDWRDDEEGGYLLVESNCAVHRVAERYPKVCAMELALFREALGPDVSVERLSHIASGDTTCTYRIRPKSPGSRKGRTAG